MANFAKVRTEKETRAAAGFFPAIRATAWIRVVETPTVPKTRPIGGIFLPLTGADAGVEPIGDRIIEAPENTNDVEILRNPRSGFVAYVPPGSVAKGEALVINGVTSSGKKVTACAACHGFDSRGIGPVPALAGRSPS